MNSMFMGFEGMDEPSKRIAFGTSAGRPTFPDQIAHDRFGNEMNPIRGVRDVGPGQYDDHLITTFTNFNKPLSNKGYILGARLAQRKAYQITNVGGPSPGEHQDINRKDTKPAFRPFNQSADRFKRETADASLPGPGAYEHTVERGRSVRMLHSFGGRTKSSDHVRIKCNALERMQKCESCNEPAQGDFYSFKRRILCNRCYEYNFKWQEKYTRAHLTSFQKARDCGFMHEHGGTQAAIQKISDKELRKLKQKEAYLSLYWP